MRVSQPHHLTFLGEGENGIVLLVNGDVESRLAVKITFASKFPEEALIAKELSVLKPHTQAFITTHGWYERQGLEPEWIPVLPLFRQDGEVIDWEKYNREKLVYIFMEHSNFRMRHETPAAAAGVVFWETVSSEESKKLLFILLHGIFVARKVLQFSHNDIHDGQILLFKRDPREPILLGNRYQIENCRWMPKLIDFGTSTIGETEFSDDVARLIITFFQLPNLKELMDSVEYDESAGSSQDNYQVVKNLLDSDYFKEFHSATKRPEKAAVCISCMSVASSVIENTKFHVCGEKCAEKFMRK